MKSTVEHVSVHGEWWGADQEWLLTVTIHGTDGTYLVLPQIALGPFDTLSDHLPCTGLEWQQVLL